MWHYNPRCSLEIGSLLICVASAAFAIFLLIVGDVGVDGFSSAVPLLVLAFLLGAYSFYRLRRPEPTISDICGALAVVIFSGSAAGIISLAGLRLNAPLIDGNLAALDSALLLDSRSIVTATASSPFFSGLMGLAYISSFPILFASIVLLGWMRKARALWQLSFVFAFTAVGCATISAFFPAMGAFSYFEYPASVYDGLPAGSGVYHLAKFEYYRHAVAPVISMSSLQGVVTFPSFHCCLALMTAFAFVEHRWLFLASFLWNGLVIISTIPIGGHYLVDLPAGAALWGMAYVLATALWRGTGGTPLNVQPSKTASDSGPVRI